MISYINKNNSFWQTVTFTFRCIESLKEMGSVEGYKLSHETYKRYHFCVFSQQLTELLLRLYKEKLCIRIDTNTRRQNRRNYKYQFSDISVQWVLFYFYNTPVYMIRQVSYTHQNYFLGAGLTFSLCSNTPNVKLLTQQLAFDPQEKGSDVVSTGLTTLHI
jgi:hypothetical protein